MPKRLDPSVAIAVMRESGLEPLVPYPGAAKPWKVKCNFCGTIGTPTYAHVNNRGGGCKECGRVRTADAKRIPPDEAESLMLKNGYLPQEPFHEGKTPWKCIHIICGNYVSPQYTNIAGGQGGCLYCGRIESARKRRLDEALVTKELIELGFKPLVPYPGTKNRWKCECVTCGKEFTTSLENARAGAHPHCPTCNRSRMGKLRRLSTSDAAQELLRVGLTPIGDFPGSHALWECICTLCGSKTSFGITSARIRVAKNSTNPALGCETCVFAAIGKSRVLDQAEAERRLVSLNMRPIGNYVGTFEPILAICLTCGAENDVQLGKAFSRGHACTSCSLRKRTEAARKPEDEAIAEMLKAGFRPLDKYQNFNTAWRSVHLECGQEVSPSLGAIRRGSGCSFCAKYGFDSASPAVLYVLRNDEFKAIKVGITGTQTTRLKSLSKRHGWVTVHEFEFETGSSARSIERLVLNWWRADLELPIGVLPKDSGSLGGWTETAPLGLISAEQTVSYIENVINVDKKTRNL
jgi:hypothetical protein